MTRTRRGPRFVLGLYAVVVAFAGVAGLLFATVVERPEPPALFFLVPLPPTRLGFAVYGVVTVGTVLGVALAGVVYASRTLDEPERVDRRGGRDGE